MIKNTAGNLSKRSDTLLMVGILLIAINLRPALASVGPLIEDIRQTTGLSNSLLGLLTTLPLIAFGLISTLTPLFTKRFGISGTLLGAMILLSLGIAIRSVAWISTLYFGTLILGIAIALGNVLLPTLTKQNFASNSGFITSLYSSTMAVGAAIAAGISVPLADNFTLGWRGSLGVWSLLSLMAALVWIPQLPRLKNSNPNRTYLEAMRNLGKSKVAWQVALFMGFQSFTFYVILAWLPAILQSRSFDASFAGWMLSLSQATGILGSLIIPVLAGNKKDQRSIVLFLFTLEIVSLIGLFLPQWGWVAVWVSVLGFVLGGTFGLSLLFIVLRSQDAQTTTELSGMAQSVGYLVAATGPILFGSIFDLTGNWTYPFFLLFVIASLKLATGLGAGKPE